jgi:hypothetical protein
VEEHLEKLSKETATQTEEACSVCCGSSLVRDLKPQVRGESVIAVASFEPEAELSHWPVQLHLVNPQSRFLQNADLLIAADCVPFAYADFHRKFLAGRSLLVGCPKLR